MLKMVNRTVQNAVSGVFALSLLGVALAAPAQAMKEPPTDPVSGSTSGGSSGGTAVPEPSSLALFGAGAAAFMFARRRAAKKG